jgi:hypothetical protein
MKESVSVERPFEAGVFDDIPSAARAVDGLLAAGFSHEQITVICSDETKERYFREFHRSDPSGSSDMKATVTGSAIGAILGGTTILVSAAVTGGAAILAAGPLVAAAGGIFGGFIGQMMTRGGELEPEDFYQQAVQDGRILIAAEDDGPNAQRRLALAARTLASAGAKPLPLREG